MEKIRVAIIEDSNGNSMLLRQILKRDSLLELVGIFDPIKSFLSLPKCGAKVILLDANLSTMDSCDFTRKLLNEYVTAVLIISSDSAIKVPKLILKAMEVGALSVVEKPSSVLDPEFKEKSDNIIEMVKIAAKIDFSHKEYKNNGRLLKSSRKVYGAIEAVAIGSSLGGPHALKVILSTLPSDFSVPIFVVQHISPGFTQELVKWLNNYTKLQIKVACHLENPEAGIVYFAPDNYNMIINSNCRIQFFQENKTDIIQPSVSALFKSVTSSYGKKAVGILLTGMGSDGVHELLSLSKKGAVTIVQNKQSSAMFGMPKEAIKIGAAKYILPLEEIASKLLELIKL